MNNVLIRDFQVKCDEPSKSNVVKNKTDRKNKEIPEPTDVKRLAFRLRERQRESKKTAKKGKESSELINVEALPSLPIEMVLVSLVFLKMINFANRGHNELETSDSKLGASFNLKEVQRLKPGAVPSIFKRAQWDVTQKEESAAKRCHEQSKSSDEHSIDEEPQDEYRNDDDYSPIRTKRKLKRRLKKAKGIFTSKIFVLHLIRI
uniref:Uncharacterized protein n=1 Tax=Amphimedon queenslandica TaxID=400682 RepID=A0A1X7V423_AMPQE